MSAITIDECKAYIPCQIDYEQKLIQMRKTAYIELQIYLDTLKNDDYQNYLHLCSKYKFEPEQNEKDFRKWQKWYGSTFENRLNGFSKDWDINKHFLLNKISDDEYFAYSFVKDPGRMTMHQSYAAEWIRENVPLISEFSVLPASGANALYVERGTIRSGADYANSKNEQPTKSIDFQWCYEMYGKKLMFYATHKYTKDSGGSQDNQYKDVQKFLNEARSCIDSNVVLLSITDGEYYQRKHPQNKELKKIDYLKEALQGSRTCATTSNDLLKDILPFIEKWIYKVFSNNINDLTVQEELQKIEILKKA